MPLYPKILVVGAKGIGKSAQAIEACSDFLDRVDYIAPEVNAWAPMFDRRHNPRGLRPRVHPCFDPDNSLALTKTALTTAYRNFGVSVGVGIIFDSWTLLMQAHFAKIKASKVQNAPLVFTDDIADLLRRVVAYPGVVIATAHEREPAWFKNRVTERPEFKQGGADVIGQFSRRIAHAFDAVLRLASAPDTSGSPRRVIYRDELNPDWGLKDRWNVIKDGEEATLLDYCKRVAAKQKAAEGR